MTYYEDLTTYQYFARHEPPELTTLNVGWLSREMRYPEGDTSQEFKARLFEFCLDEFVVHLARGFHVCEFCYAFSPLSSDAWLKLGGTRYGENTHWMGIGNGEIRVIGKAAIYAAPTLVYHYVAEHRYCPPEEFIEAVLMGPGPGSEEHKALLGRYR